MPRVLVAGAAGFIGSHLVDLLLARGNEVVGVDSFTTGTPQNIAHLESHEGFIFIEADVTQPLAIPDRLHRIYHLACPASPIDYLQKPFETLYAGSDGTRELLRLAERHGARFLLASTSEVYGDPAEHPQRETYFGNVNPIGPRSVYVESKRYAEALTMAFHRHRGVQVRIARIFNTYGPRMRMDDGRVIPAFACQALRGEPLTVFGDGEQTRSYCYISDMLEGLTRLMASDCTGPCNLGNPFELSVMALAEWLISQTQSASEFSFKPLPQDDPRLRRPEISLARRELGWEPKVSFGDGIKSTIAWFKEEVAFEQELQERHKKEATKGRAS
ncbi:MAG: SDR family oxidoreductase [Proteobacteria bacterium]|nr:SDR family oxidoreductase [Pseudomonadota bacterium]